MFASPDLFNVAAKRLAMLAVDHVGKVAQAITKSEDYPAEVTGTVLGIMPHLVEKAILTSPGLPADMAVRMCEHFVNEFEAVEKIVCNAGGFSNPLKKALFNAGFHTIFRHEYNDLKPKVDKLWESARLEQADPISYLASITLKRVGNAVGYPIESDESIDSAYKVVEDLFARVHKTLSGA